MTDQTPCGPVPTECDAEAGEPCANHERQQAHAEGEHCFCGPECATTSAADQTERRDRYVEALWPLTDWDGDRLNAERAADAVMAVADAEQAEARAAVERVRAFLDRDQDGLCCSHVTGQIRALLNVTTPAAAPAVDRAALRDRIADAIRAAACTGDCGQTEEECAKERIQPFVWHHGTMAVVEGSPEQIADAVLAVLPDTGRAAAFREAADIAESLRQFESATGARKSAQVSENVGILRVAEELRRRAACPWCESGTEHDVHCPTPETHNWGCGCPSDVAAAIASCPGREMSPSPCRCPCYGCKHHCGAHNPAELRRLADETPAAERRCTCSHPSDEHSVYGCADDCACEWMPKKKPPMDPVHILGIKADDEPAAGARCTCADAGACFAPAGHYADCPAAGARQDGATP